MMKTESMNLYPSMTHFFFRFLFFVLISVCCFPVRAQTCSFTPSAIRVCLGATVTFTPSFAGGTPSKYEWDFGDGKKDSVQKPTYKYNNAGTFNVTLKITFSGGSLCNAGPLSISVLPLPVADMTVESYPVQCFLGNYFCLKDRSYATGAPLNKRTILWGDGGAIQNAPLSQKDFCQSYASIGTFTPVIEVADTNGCIARKELKDAIKVAVDVDAGFTYSTVFGCGTRSGYFYNKYLTDRSDVKNFWWDFGDGSPLVKNPPNPLWDSIGYFYNTPGNFLAKLIFESTGGCFDTFALPIINYPKPDFNISYTISPNPVCYRDRGAVFLSASFSQDVVYTWAIYDEFGQNPSALMGRTTYIPPSFISSCGDFPILLQAGTMGCDTIFFDTIHVRGPMADLEKPPLKIGNRYQCDGDTAYMPPSNLHFSDFCSTSIKFLWNFGDPYAAQCTTDTRRGINTGMNCNFSRDSIGVKHKYTSGVDSCYKVKMYLIDTITGCWDYDSATVIVGPPESSGIIPSKPWCLHANIDFNLDYAEPKCEKQNVWILPDSACANATWNKVFPPYFQWIYDYTCNSTGWVTVGFVIQNGNCFDTTWYHNMLYFEDFDGSIIANVNRSCDSLQISISFRDSLQKGISYVVWDFENGTFLIIDTLDSNYVKLPSRSYTYYQPGIKTPLITLHNDSGCERYTYRIINWGHYASFRYDSVVCTNSRVWFIDSVRYYHQVITLDTVPWWRRDTTHQKLYWDFGDGTPVVHGAVPSHIYTTPGIYTVKMTSVDSFNCAYETIGKIRVSGVKPDFGLSDTLFVCGQIVRMYDSSFAEPQQMSGYPKLDSIVAWTWDFGDGKTVSHLKNPYHDYTSFGKFKITLTSINANGCMDSITKTIRIKGPQPSFEVDGDTIGCVPFTAKFKNTSSDTKYWIWNYGDSSVYSSNVFENVQHTYTKPGIYDVWISGVDSFQNPITQNLYYCTGTFPDPFNPFQKRIRIYVLPIPLADFSFNQPVCAGQPIFFKDSSNSIYTHYRWNLPGGDSLVADSPVNTKAYIFNQSGSYQISYTPSYKPPSGFPYCPDTIARTIQVVDVKADFEIDTIQSQDAKFYFTNTSVNGVLFQWNFGHPSSLAKNLSSSFNGFHDYTGDTGYFTVCLTATSPEGCVDSVCKLVHNEFYPFIFIPNVYTPDNSDGFNDAFDIPIKGEDYYNLIIYNRWGEVVFKGDRDGEKNDGVNWNGRKFNTGEPCASGTYYFIFEYHFPNDKWNTIKKGPVTLIRPTN